MTRANSSCEYMREYGKKNRARLRAIHARRLAAFASGDVTKQQLLDLHKRSKGLCAYCGASVPLVPERYSRRNYVGFDHVLPFCKGGKHTITNMVVCCGPCNKSKGKKTLEEWRRTPNRR